MAAAVAVLVPGAAFAIHNFTDVPDAHFAHADVDAIRRAGITAGANCPPTAAPSFCPNNNVTRGQMAAFLNRGLSRVAQESTASGPDIPGAQVVLVDLVNESILVPGTSGPGLTQYVKADAQVRLDSSAPGCPCDFAFNMTDGSTGSPDVLVQARAGAGGDVDETYTFSWVFVRPAGSTATITVRGFLEQSTTAPPAGTTYNVFLAQLILTTFPTAADGAVGTLGPEQATPAPSEHENPNQ